VREAFYPHLRAAAPGPPVQAGKDSAAMENGPLAAALPARSGWGPEDGGYAWTAGGWSGVLGPALLTPVTLVGRRPS